MIKQTGLKSTYDFVINKIRSIPLGYSRMGEVIGVSKELKTSK